MSVAIQTPPPPTADFDFAGVVVTFGPYTLLGGLDSIKVSRVEDNWTYHVSSDGTVTRVKNNNRMGQVVLTYGQNAPALDVLSSLAQADEKTGSGKYPIQVRDAGGRSIATATLAWIKKPADAEYGKESTTREWTFDCDQLTHFVGGLN